MLGSSDLFNSYKFYMQTDANPWSLHSQKPACLNKGLSLLVCFQKSIKNGILAPKTCMSYYLMLAHVPFFTASQKIAQFYVKHNLNCCYKSGYSKKFPKICYWGCCYFSASWEEGKANALWVKNQLGAHWTCYQGQLPIFSNVTFGIFTPFPTFK